MWERVFFYEIDSVKSLRKKKLLVVPSPPVAAGSATPAVPSPAPAAASTTSPIPIVSTALTRPAGSTGLIFFLYSPILNIK